MNDATKATAKQLRDAMKSRFGRAFNVTTHTSAHGTTFTIVCPKTRLDMGRIGFSLAEAAEIGNVLGLRDFETEFHVPDALVSYVLANLASGSPKNLIEMRSKAMAGGKI